MKSEKELKAAIRGLESEKQYGNLYVELVERLIDIYELDHKDKADFWKRRLEMNS